MDKPLTPLDKQILAITNRIRKAKNPDKAKAKIRELQIKKQRNAWLGQ